MSLLIGSLSCVDLDQLARDMVRFERLAEQAAAARRWNDVAFLNTQRDLTVYRRYVVLRQYLAHEHRLDLVISQRQKRSSG